MGCMMPFVQGLQQNRTEEDTPHVVGVVEGVQEREEIAASKRWRRSPNSRELPPHRGYPLQSDSNARLGLAATTICSLSMPSWAPRDADDALFAVNYITGITTPIKPLIFSLPSGPLFSSLSPTRLWVHLSEIGLLGATTPHTPFTRRSNNLRPCLPAGFRDIPSGV